MVTERKVPIFEYDSSWWPSLLVVLKEEEIKKQAHNGYLNRDKTEVFSRSSPLAFTTHKGFIKIKKI